MIKLRSLFVSIAAILLLVMTQTAVSGQQRTDSTTLERFVLRKTVRLHTTHLKTGQPLDTVISYSYLVVFDEQSRFDTLILSAQARAYFHPRGIEELKQAYRYLDTLRRDLRNAALFVPVLSVPQNTYYRISPHASSTEPDFSDWAALFDVLDPEILKHKHLKYTFSVHATSWSSHSGRGSQKTFPARALVMPAFRKQQK